MQTLQLLPILALMLLLDCNSVSGLGADSDQVWVNPSLLAAFQQKTTVSIMITMRDRPAPILAQVSTQTYASRTARINTLYKSLDAHAQRTQAPVLQLISQTTPDVSTKSFWITNQIYVQDATLSLVETLSRSSSDILTIDEDMFIQLEPLPETPKTETAGLQGGKSPSDAEWGIVMVKAPHVWDSPEFMSNGSGITVGIIDTGVRATHVALQTNYRNDGFSWFDPYEYANLPKDDEGHGTHVTGTILGNNGIGVAPGAQFIACRGLTPNGGTVSGLTACGQYMVCPTRPNGQDPDCSLAPRVVSNSWGGAGGVEFYNGVIAAWHEADIIPIFAIGNEGEKGCSSAGSPGDQRDVIAVGATTTSDSLAYFSSLGPSQQSRRTPDIAAPGHRVRSSYNSSDTAYAILSGTSMACPHVAGVVALLLSHKPFLKFDQVRTILEGTTDHDLTFTHVHGSCGGLPISVFPNNHFGYGRVNAFKAMQEASGYSHGAQTYPSAGLSIMIMISIAVNLYQN